MFLLSNRRVLMETDRVSVFDLQSLLLCANVLANDLCAVS